MTPNKTTVMLLMILIFIPMTALAETDQPASVPTRANGVEQVYPPANMTTLANHSALLSDTLQRFNLTLEDNEPSIRTDLVLTFGLRNPDNTRINAIVYNYELQTLGGLEFIYTETGYFVMMSFKINITNRNTTDIGMELMDKIDTAKSQRNITYNYASVMVSSGTRYKNANYLEVFDAGHVFIFNIVNDTNPSRVDDATSLSNAREYISSTFPELNDSNLTKYEFVTNMPPYYNYDTERICKEVQFYYNTSDPLETLVIDTYFDVHTGAIVFHERYSNFSAVEPEPIPHEDTWYPILRTIWYISVGIAVFLVFIVLLISGYAKLNANGLFNNVQRKKIYEYIKKNPGTHFRKIMRATGLKQGSLGYHLNKMEKQELIKSQQKGMFRCFFTSEARGEVRIALSNVQQAILFAIRDRPGITVTELSEKISRSKMIASYHASILSSAGLIEKHKVGKTMALFLASDIDEHYLY